MNALCIDTTPTRDKTFSFYKLVEACLLLVLLILGVKPLGAQALPPCQSQWKHVQGTVPATHWNTAVHRLLTEYSKQLPDIPISRFPAF